MTQARETNPYDGSDIGRHRRQWYAYYSQKRIVHQWLQVKLLEPLPVSKVLEIGPHLGAVTAMLVNAGYDVTTLDIEPKSRFSPARRHIRQDITRLAGAELKGFDVILCCETLEHIPWAKVDGVLNALKDSGSPWLVVSVPYEGFQFAFRTYVNPFTWRKSTSFKVKNFMRYALDGDEFGADRWEAHKWETGYRDYPVKRLLRKFEANGWTVETKEFTADCRSIFLVCKNI